jgi:hypothetical protein
VRCYDSYSASGEARTAILYVQRLNDLERLASPKVI